jgi:hypothetical protein
LLYDDELVNLSFSMELGDARRIAVRQRVQIQFDTPAGACIIDEHGVARMPSLSAGPEFRISEEFQRAAEFAVISNGQLRTLSRRELEEMCAPSVSAAHADE